MPDDIIDIRYLAGFVDGEGCISISSRQTGVPYIRLRIANTNLEVVKKIQKQYGGSFYKVKKRKGSKQVYSWEVSTNLAINLIRQLEPYLIVKRYQAQLVEQFVIDMPGHGNKWDINTIEMYIKLFRSFNERGDDGETD